MAKETQDWETLIFSSLANSIIGEIVSDRSISGNNLEALLALERHEEAILREIFEETNARGNILFCFSKQADHITFLVDIGNEEVRLGYDPEEVFMDPAERSLQGLLWLPLSEVDTFTDIDKHYFRELVQSCNSRDYRPGWLPLVECLVGE